MVITTGPRSVEARRICQATIRLSLQVILLLLPLAASAQTINTGTITGQVLDENGAAIVRAEVVITNQATGLRRETYTDASGYFTLGGLPLTGQFRLTIASSGFARQETSGIELRAGVAAFFNITLVPEGGRSEVIVSGTTEGVQSESPQLGTRFDLQKIDNTPVFGRKITNLVQLNSAVRPARGTGDLFLNNFLFVINGGGRRQTTYTLDGSTGDDVWGRQTIFTNIPLSALQEFTVLTNGASAEYGRTTGSAVNIITKSGTNDYHLDVVGLVRPGAFQARSPLALQRTADRLRQLSGVVSGPIILNRTYFLIGAEYNNQLRDSTITSLVAPGVYTGRYGQGLLIGRIDHQINLSNALTARFNMDRLQDTNPADAVGGNNLSSAARIFTRRAYAAQLSETANFRNSMLNEARVQMQVGSPITEFDPVGLSTQFVRPGLSTEGESRSTTLINHQYQFVDTFSWMRGRQYIKLGGDAIFSSSGGTGQEFGSGFVLGQFSFRGNSANVNNPNVPTSALTLADVQRYTQSFGNANYNVREWLWSLFFQDDIRVHTDLTLNLGLRYERETFTDDTNNFAPRFGFAYNVLGDARTVLRGSYGIYYSEIRANAGAQYAINGPAGIFTFSAAPGQLGFPSSFAALPAFPAGAVLPARDIIIRPGRAAYYSQFFDVSRLRGYPDKLLNPYTQQTTFGIERALPGKIILSADYVYAHTIGIDRLLDLNAPSLFVRTSQAQVRSATAADQTRPIVPLANGFRRIQVTVNEGSSIYEAMQLNLNRRFGNGFSILASYTYSHTLNTVEPDAPGGDPNDVNQVGRFERGDSLLDQRHRFVLSGWWQLRYRFVLGGVTTLASGRPYNITTGVDNNGDGATTDRPVIDGVVIGRNTGRGTPVYDVSMFVERTFNLTEKVQLLLRGEAFNLFNHPNIVARNGVQSSVAFGQGIGGINGVDPGREFQFLLRVRY